MKMSMVQVLRQALLSPGDLTDFERWSGLAGQRLYVGESSISYPCQSKTSVVYFCVLRLIYL